MKEKIKIDLTSEECEIFKWCQEFYDIFNEAKNKLKPGSLVLHFKNNGKLSKYELHIYPQVDGKKHLTLPLDKL
jgi:hypothetical protein